MTDKPQEEIDLINSKKSCSMNFSTLWGLDLDAPGSVYLIKVKEGSFKIGITSRNIFQRYSYDLDPSSIILNESAEDISHAFMIEQIIKKKFMHTIKKDDYGPFGWTEVLNDVCPNDISIEILSLLESKEVVQERFNAIRSS